MKNKLSVIVVSCSLFTASCKSGLLADKMGAWGTTNGEAYGALVGKQGGNAVIGATIGKVIGAGTANFLGSKLQGSPNKKPAPIYIIDGEALKSKQAQTMLQNVSPNNIDNFKILSDEEATALYGDKGQYGAIVINLKKI